MSTRKSASSLAVATLCAAQVHAQATPPTNIVVDAIEGRPGPVVQPDETAIAGGTRYTIGETQGWRPGGASGVNLLQSFADFVLGVGDEALFTADSSLTTRNIIARVDGGNPSAIHGRLAMDIPGASLWLLNPAGLFFGSTATLDVQGSFHASTADVLRMQTDDGTPVIAFSQDAALAVAHPVAFGFLSQAPAAITVDGATLDVSLEDRTVQPPDRDISLVGGDVTLGPGTFLATQTGRLLVASAASAGDVAFGTGALPDTSSLATLGAVTLDGAELYAEGVIPFGNLTVGGGSIAIAAGNLTLTGSKLSTGVRAAGPAGVGVSLQAREDFTAREATLSTWFDDIVVEAGNIDYAGSIATNGSFPVGSQPRGGDIRLTALGDLTVEGGLRSSGNATIAGSGGGRIELQAGDALTVSGSLATVNNSVRLGAGSISFDGELTVTSSGGIDFEAEGPVSITGSVRGIVGALSQSTAGSSISVATSGDVSIDAAELSVGGNVAGGGNIFIDGDHVTATNSSFSAVGFGTIAFTGTSAIELTDVDVIGTATNQNAIGSTTGADIQLTAPEIRLDGVSLNTSAVAALNSQPANGGSIAIDADDVAITGGSVLQSTGIGISNPGEISIAAAGSLLIGGGSRLSTVITGDGAGRTGGQQAITLQAGTIELVDDALVTSEAFGEAQNAGDIAIAAGTSLLLRDATVTAAAEVGGGGGITVASAGEIYALRSTVETRVQSSGGNAGNIGVSGASVVLNASRVVASAAAGDGGGITLSGGQVLVSADSVLDASSEVGTDGVVTIDAPDVDLESGLATLTTEFLDPSRLLRPSCDTADAATQGRFAVRTRAGAPVSPEELLVDDGPRVAQASDPAGVKVATRGTSTISSSAAFRGGQFGEAAIASEAAVRSAVARGDAIAEAEALSVLGNAQTALGDVDGALASLTRAIKVAQDTGDTALAANISNNLGNHWTARQDSDRALDAYREAARLAQQAGDHGAQARALANAARAALRGGDAAAGAALLEDAAAVLDAIVDGPARTDLLIHLARTHTELAESGTDRGAHLLAAHGLLTTAATTARAAGDLRQLSYALGNTGRLYELEGRTSDGLYLTRQALSSAEPLDAADLLYRWHWQAARLLRAAGDRDGALQEYQRAVAMLEESRQETLARYGDAEIEFRRAVAPVYRQYVDLLLQEPDGSATLAARLQEARSTMELLKGAELRDYFRNACVAELQARTASLDEIAGTAAVVYPVALDDRLELLVSVGGTLHRARAAVPAAQLEQVAQAFRASLQQVGSSAYRAQARQLYDWIVRPIEPVLREARADTLVFVPGGALRAIPMAALLDGDTYLVERYALAVTPSLHLIDPTPLNRSSVRLFAAGISESVQGQPALPSVPTELAAINEIFGGARLLNADFRVERVDAAIREQRPTIVHIASHGVFTGDPDRSYLLAYDQPLTMNRLSEMIGVARFREDPLALLVLSACQTAEGDDRAALGLAGVAIRAGARSAMGSLWSIADDAAVELIKNFYRELKASDASRAEALQRAQLALLRQERFAHPFFWSPFLMVNNWL